MSVLRGGRRRPARQVSKTSRYRGAARVNIQKSQDITEFPSAPSADHEERLSDPERLLALAETEIMDSPPEDVFDRAARLATTALGVPLGLASFVDDRRQFFKAQCGLPEAEAAKRETPLSHSFCQYVVAHDRTLAVSDARDHPLLRSNGAVSDMDVIAYLGVPIHAPGGQSIGSFCAIDDKPRTWSERDVEVMTDLAGMVETELQLRHERDAMETLARELNHRVKNLFSIVGGMVTLTARSSETPSEMAQVLQGRLSALDWAHSMISPALSEGDLATRSIDLRALVERLVQPHLTSGADRLGIDVPDLELSGRVVTDLALVIHELATNAAKYGALSGPEGRVDVSGTLDETTLEVIWREAGGPDIPEAPSETGFGSRLIELTIVRQMNGGLETTWHRSGVVHCLTVPRTVIAPKVDPSAS
ncbi:two-component sensor histidine kinase [Marivita geojedonensis]|nr:two-component sensor histidine kinase [Marivita geojedonensis]